MDGRASWRELTGLCTQHAIRRALDRGEIRSVGRGLYALPELPAPREAAATAGGVLSHLSAAAYLGLAVLVRPDAVHVTVPRATHRVPVTGVAVHRSDLEVADASRIATRPLRTVLDCAATLPFAEALAVADSALREGFVRREDLIYAAELRRGPGRRTVVRVAHTADGDAANPFESALRATVLDAGLSGFVPQQAVTVKSITGGPMPVHVDLGDRVRRVALEADSYEHHGSRAALRDDCRRYDELVRAGWLVLRFAWEHVLFDAGWLAGVVGDTCASRAA
jgi:very-short-patch-repair endonuclease